tara:strand:+ start:415 stop:582 length:168 start_codon:yes stop_codon:yes gene_type:complete
MKRVLDNRHWNKNRTVLMKGAKDKSHSSRRVAREQWAAVRTYAPPNEHNGWRVGE